MTARNAFILAHCATAIDAGIAAYGPPNAKGVCVVNYATGRVTP
jgi:hypothetical protein